MKPEPSFKIRWFPIISGVVLLLLAAAATPAVTGLEASAAADQVKIGSEYLQARAEMDAWVGILRAVNFAGAGLLLFGIVRPIFPNN